MPKPPHNEHELELALIRRAGNNTHQSLIDRMTMANAIVGQFLAAGSGVKGGSALRFRYGSMHSRYTMDFDTTHRTDLDEFLSELKRNLFNGWNGFTGECDIMPPAHPIGVPFEYVMQPVRVKLLYKSHPWCTIRLEITKASAGCADQFDTIYPDEETIKLFNDLGFPEPGPIYAMKLDHQIAQKIRGASCIGSARAHDLIDLQIILRNDTILLSNVKRICKLIFRGRNCPVWPPIITKNPDWDIIYNEQKLDLPVLPTVDEAIDWANSLIARIDASDSDIASKQ